MATTASPPITCHITTNSSDGKAYFHHTASTKSEALGPQLDNTYLYSAENPTNLSENQDLSAHISSTNASPLPILPAMSFPTHGGSIFAVLDYKPNPEGKPSLMRRAQMLGYAIVISGEVELLLDSGEKRICKAGDCVVQRASMHAWKNLSGTEVARIAVVGLSCEKVVVGGKEFEEDFSAMKARASEKG